MRFWQIFSLAVEYVLFVIDHCDVKLQIYRLQTFTVYIRSITEGIHGKYLINSTRIILHPNFDRNNQQST